MGEIPEFAFDLDDEDTWAILCPFCFGDGCEKCGTLGIIEEDVSAKSYFDDDAGFIFGDVIWFLEHGVLPFPNKPRNEQCANFLEAVNIVKSARFGIEKMRTKNG